MTDLANWHNESGRVKHVTGPEILAIDVGTTTVHAMTIGSDGRHCGHGSAHCELSYPGPGLVEQDTGGLYDAVCLAIGGALRDSNTERADLVGIGITGQRASLVVWEPSSMKAAHPMVSWQDLRGAKRALELQEAGFLLMHIQPVCKLEAVIDAIPDGRARMKSGTMVWGDVPSYVMARLSGGAIHATDAGHAQATAYYDYEHGSWDARLLELQNLEERFFPTMLDSQGSFGETSAEVFGAKVPILALLGDQQSALFAQSCRTPGQGKVTYGTSATANVHTGELTTKGGFPVLMWRRDAADTYGLEGMVLTAGATFEHLVDLGVLDDVTSLGDVGGSVSDTQGVHMLPAQQGLGWPYMDPERLASIHGMTRGTTAAHIARAAMEGVAFRVRQVLDHQYGESQLPRPDALRVDGGASCNDALMQIQANVLGTPVERMSPIEATVHGVGLMAGIAAGLWDDASVRELRRVDRTFVPAWSEDERQGRFSAWCDACRL